MLNMHSIYQYWWHGFHALSCNNINQWHVFLHASKKYCNNQWHVVYATNYTITINMINSTRHAITYNQPINQ